jgi:antitoxin component of RelBE/YafQ-DinJ toxin-antitoxin module
MKNIKNKEAIIILRLEEKLKLNYLRFCKENGYSLSKRIRVLLENDMKNGK